ncbi:MAG: tetraacyldisaccharide 4'-kinase [Bdellovibrionales bacterium]
MKAPAFWYEPPGALAALLAPFGFLYGLAGKLRRALTSPYRTNATLICIGNIVAGGAGKTPTCLALYKKLALAYPEGKIGFVTRGYGGREKGPLRVDPTKHTAAQVGDEALLLAQAGPCWIGCDRAAAVREAEKECALILMDDGMQNPTILPDLTLLVVDAGAGFGNERVIPAGPLREKKEDALPRVAAVVLIGDKKTKALDGLDKPVYRGFLRPSLSPSFLSHPRVLAFAGIGRPSKFYESCCQAGLNVEATRDFPDHYAYRTRDIERLVREAEKKGLSLITTAKDLVRLSPKDRQKVGVLTVELVLEANDEAKLLALVGDAMDKKGK